MKLITALKLLRQGWLKAPPDPSARFTLASKLLQRFYPPLAWTEYGRTWLEDDDFFEYYRKFSPDNPTSADRKFFLRELLKLIDDLPGDTAECGAYLGATSYLICQKAQVLGKSHSIFDSFEGLSAPDAADGGYWSGGDLTAAESQVRANLAGFDCFELYKGWIPERFPEVADRRFCFVHVDVDLYQPTRDSVAFFYPRLVPGGLLVCDDYGFSTCPGARRAVDEYMADRPEPVLQVPTGQGVIIKK